MKTKAPMFARILIAGLVLCAAGAACKGDECFKEIWLYRDGYAGVHPVSGSGQGAEYVYKFYYDFRALKRIEHLRNGVPHANPEGWARAEIDERAGGLSIKYFDARGKPARVRGGFPRRSGYHEMIIEVPSGSEGKIKYIKYMDKDGLPTKDGWTGVHITLVRFNERGDVVEKTHRKRDGSPMLSSIGGHHKEVFKYDQHGRLVEKSFFGREMYFDAKGRSVVGKGGYHKISYKHSPAYFETERRFYGADGKPK